MIDFVVNNGEWIGLGAVLSSAALLLGFAVWIVRSRLGPELAVAAWSSFAQILSVLLAITAGLAGFAVYMDDRREERKEAAEAAERQRMSDAAEIIRDAMKVELAKLREDAAVMERRLVEAKAVLLPLADRSNQLVRLPELQSLTNGEVRLEGASGRIMMSAITGPIREFEVSALSGAAFVSDLAIQEALVDFQAQLTALTRGEKATALITSAATLSAKVSTYLSALQSDLDQLRRHIAEYSVTAEGP